MNTAELEEKKIQAVEKLLRLNDLSINEEVIGIIRQYEDDLLRQKRKTFQKPVFTAEDYEVSDYVRNLSGGLNIPENVDYKELVSDYLWEKYGH